MGLIAIVAPIAGWQFSKRKVRDIDADEVMAAEAEMQRNRGLKNGSAS